MQHVTSARIDALQMNYDDALLWAHDCDWAHQTEADDALEAAGYALWMAELARWWAQCPLALRLRAIAVRAGEV